METMTAAKKNNSVMAEILLQADSPNRQIER
jgi:hypothetical protein